MTLVSALADASTILGAGWTFIEANPILSAICTLGVLTGAVGVVKGFFA